MNTAPRRRTRPLLCPSLWLLLMLSITVTACGDGDSDPAASDPGSAATASQDSAATSDASSAAAPEAKLNLNTATREEFLTVPQVNDRMAHEFDEYRPYVSIRQFRREIGKYVSEDQVAAYEQYVYVPVDPDGSDAQTVQQLPGVDADEAAALVEDRPYADREAFLKALGTYVTEDERANAETYLAAP